MGISDAGWRQEDEDEWDRAVSVVVEGLVRLEAYRKGQD